jgi:hypothetical protein
LQATLHAWRRVCQEQQRRRHILAVAVARVDQSLKQQQLLAAVRFWHRHAMALVCQRWNIPLPLLRPRVRCFDAWLWRHVSRQQAEQRAAAWQLRRRLATAFAGWRQHTATIAAMRAAWDGVSLYTGEQLLRWGLVAFVVGSRQQGGGAVR